MYTITDRVREDIRAKILEGGREPGIKVRIYVCPNCGSYAWSNRATSGGICKDTSPKLGTSSQAWHPLPESRRAFYKFTFKKGGERMSTTSYRLKNLRMAQGYTKTDVAKAAGVTRRTVYGWESDTMTPTTANIIQLAKLFHVSADYLLGLTDSL